MLTLDDAGIYYPFDLVDPNRFPSEIAYLTAIAEGSLGAQRELSQRLYVERQALHEGQREYFPRCWPIDTTRPVIVETCWINGRDRFRRAIVDSPWEVLEATNYELDEKAIRFIDSQSSLTQDFGRSRSFYGQRQIKLTYTGGFDFTSNAPEIAALKMAMGQLLEYHTLNMGAGDMRIQTEDVFQESRTTYFGTASKGATPGTVALGGFPEYLLIPFQKYRPYLYRF
jgi:hypothetical protein